MLNPQALQLLQQYLARFAATDDFEEKIESIFGTRIGSLGIRQQWLSGDFSLIPEMRILANGELGTANGAYAADLDEILVSADFLGRHQDDPVAVAGLLLEEFGHKLDRVLNGSVDSPGDEGAIFLSLVTGQSLSPELLAGLRAEEDRAVIMLDGRSIEIEQQDFTGTPGNDTISGTAGDDSIEGLDGNDNLNGLGGNDTLLGGNGNDNLNGGAGNDRLDGGSGNDFADYVTATGSVTVNLATGTASGADGNDLLISIESVRGSTFNDNLIGGSGNDYLDGIEGNDTVSGNAGNDILFGQSGNDALSGGIGNDELWGEDGNDQLFGEAGNDYLDGGSGTNTLDGGDGDDVLNNSFGSADGGAGNDVLIANYSSISNTQGVQNSATNIIVPGVSTPINYSNIENFNITGSNLRAGWHD